MKIGLLGGSFDPVHIGHTAIAEEAIDTLSLDALYFVPTKHNPWKDTEYVSTKNKLEMLNIALNKYNKMSINTIEIDSIGNDKNYTYYTLLSLLENNDNEYYYLMGMDQVCLFDKWFKAKEISELVKLVAYNREGYDTYHKNLETYHFIKMDNKPIHASSTEIRDGHIEMLDKDVLYYITHHGLYLDSMIKHHMSEKRYQHSLSVASLTKEIAESNHLNGLKGYIAGLLHDIAKELPKDKATSLMHSYYPEYINKPYPIWHQWLSRYMSETLYLIDDEDILKAIEDHTTASIDINQLGKCLYCADKLDPLRGYDSSQDIALCKENIDEGFKKSLTDFYQFSKKKNRDIDPIFYDIYNKFVGGNING